MLHLTASLTVETQLSDGSNGMGYRTYDYSSASQSIEEEAEAPSLEETASVWTQPRVKHLLICLNTCRVLSPSLLDGIVSRACL